MATESTTHDLEFEAVIREGAVIAGIMLVWGVFAVVGVAIGTIGGPGSLFGPIGDALVQLFVFVGASNVLLYVIARGIALSGLGRA